MRQRPKPGPPLFPEGNFRSHGARLRARQARGERRASWRRPPRGVRRHSTCVVGLAVAPLASHPVVPELPFAILGRVHLPVVRLLELRLAHLCDAAVGWHCSTNILCASTLFLLAFPSGQLVGRTRRPGPRGSLACRTSRAAHRVTRLSSFRERSSDVTPMFEMRCNGKRGGILRVYLSACSQLELQGDDWYLNIDNIYFQTEINNNEDLELLYKSYFKYGLLFAGLTIKNRLEEEEIEIDQIYKIINHSLRGLAASIIPILRLLPENKLSS